MEKNEQSKLQTDTIYLHSLDACSHGDKTEDKHGRTQQQEQTAFA